MIIRRWIFEFYFCSYAWMSFTCSRSFPRGVASGGLHLFLYLFGVRLHEIDRRKLEKIQDSPRIVDTALNIWESNDFFFYFNLLESFYFNQRIIIYFFFI